MYWYLTYLEHHIKSFNVVHTRVDPYLLFQFHIVSLSILLIWQVGDSVIVRAGSFLRTEYERCTVFLSKRRKCFKKDEITCKGVELSLNENVHK